MPGLKRSDRLSPVFNVEILDATELIGVVGYERELERTSERCNEEIVCAYHRSTHFERSTDLYSIIENSPCEAAFHTAHMKVTTCLY